MAHTATELRGTVVAVHPADAGGRDRLAVDDGRAGLGSTSNHQAYVLPQRRVNALPGSIQPPAAEPAVHRGPRRKVGGQEAPLAAGPHDREDGIQDLPLGVYPRAAG